MKHLISISCIILILLLSSSCKKKPTSPSTGTFYFHLHANIDTSEVDDGTTLYRDSSGRHFSLSSAQFFISGIVLQNADGTSYPFTGVYVLRTSDSEQYFIGTAPVGTYTSVTFNVGLDASANASAPSAHPSSSPFSNGGMWYGSATQGYMFMKIQGTADTTTAQNGTGLAPFSYEIGSAANLKSVVMPTRGTGSYASYTPWILTKDNTQYIHLIADFGKLLSVVNFKAAANTPPGHDSTDSYTINIPLSNTIANNIPNMFHYEE